MHRRSSQRLAHGGLLGALVALAMLCHGTSVYFVAALFVMAIAWHRITFQQVAAVMLAGAFMYSPWLAYQRFYDPPGDRLLKLHLGGQETIDSRSTLDTVVASYEDIGVRGALENKASNVRTILGYPNELNRATDAVGDLFSGDFKAAIVSLRGVRFFSFTILVGFVQLGPALLLLPRLRCQADPTDLAFAAHTLVLATMTVAFWVALQFGYGQTMTFVHLGSMAAPVLAVAGCIALTAALAPRIATVLAVLHVLFVLILYVPVVGPIPGSHGVSIAFGCIAVLSLCGFVRLSSLAVVGEIAETVPPIEAVVI